MTEATSKLVKKKKISLYWLVPILALIITSILICQNKESELSFTWMMPPVLKLERPL